MHLVGFIIRIYHNARSPERQMHLLCRQLFLTFEELVTTGVFHAIVCTSVLRPNSFYAYNLIIT